MPFRYLACDYKPESKECGIVTLSYDSDVQYRAPAGDIISDNLGTRVKVLWVRDFGDQTTVLLNEFNQYLNPHTLPKQYALHPSAYAPGK